MGMLHEPTKVVHASLLLSIVHSFHQSPQQIATWRARRKSSRQFSTKLKTGVIWKSFKKVWFLTTKLFCSLFMIYQIIIYSKLYNFNGPLKHTKWRPISRRVERGTHANHIESMDTWNCRHGRDAIAVLQSRFGSAQQQHHTDDEKDGRTSRTTISDWLIRICRLELKEQPLTRKMLLLLSWLWRKRTPIFPGDK